MAEKVEPPAVDSQPVDTRTNRQKRIEAQREKQRQRTGEIKALNALYNQSKDDPVILDILKTARELGAYHRTIAEDGVANEATGRVDKDGIAEMQMLRLNDRQRMGHLDKAAGIQEMLNYIDRRVNGMVKSES